MPVFDGSFSYRLDSLPDEWDAEYPRQESNLRHQL